MQGIARNFFTLAILYALAGMAIGIYMGMSQDHSQMPVHAHTMVAGWLMSSVFAFFYHLFPKAGLGMLAQAHFWLTGVERHWPAGLAVLAARGQREPRAGRRHLVDAVLCLDVRVRADRAADRLSQAGLKALTRRFFATC
jgi:hypothetical protein